MSISAPAPGRTRTLAIVAVPILLLSAVWLYAGPLNPPAGPITSTNKTLTEVEPRIAINATNTPGSGFSLFRISQPGSYYVTGNITGVLGRHGIEIVASGVTLDLNGFELVGAGLGFFDGVSVTVSNLTNISVRNGSIRNWGNKGVNLGSFIATNCSLTDLRASGNTGNGLNVGIGSTITNCTASNNANIGIVTNSDCKITNCTANANNNFGIFANFDCTITNCTASNNTSVGIVTGSGSTITNCTVSANQVIGIQVDANCSILKTTVNGTTAGPGVITIFEGLRIEGSSIHNNSTFGVSVNTGSDIAELAVVGCTIRGNGSAGISSEASTQVLDSVVASNGAGIILTGSCLVRGCTINSNTNSGIELIGNANVVASNTLSSNALTLASSAGILVTGTDNTIDGNRLFSNTQGGIKVNTAGNLVVRNYLARTGATITAVAGNAVAQVISPGAGFISTDPNANLTY